MNEYLDIGPERATQPTEPDITDSDLDALRRKWRAEIEEDATTDEWWGDMADSDVRVRRDLHVAASLLIQDHPVAARHVLSMTLDRMVGDREREEL